MTPLEQARSDLARLEAQLPPGVQFSAPIAKLFAAIGGVQNRIRLLEAKRGRLAAMANPEE